MSQGYTNNSALSFTLNPTLNSVTFSPTTGGIVGTTTNDNAVAGKVGELISSVIAIGSALSLTTATNLDVTSISLTAGDWTVWGNVNFNFSVGGQSIFCWANTTSVTAPDTSLITGLRIAFSGGSSGVNIPTRRFSLSATTTLYLTAQAGFSSGTATACGGIYARRAR